MSDGTSRQPPPANLDGHQKKPSSRDRGPTGKQPPFLPPINMFALNNETWIPSWHPECRNEHFLWGALNQILLRLLGLPPRVMWKNWSFSLCFCFHRPGLCLYLLLHSSGTAKCSNQEPLWVFGTYHLLRQCALKWSFWPRKKRSRSAFRFPFSFFYFLFCRQHHRPVRSGMVVLLLQVRLVRLLRHHPSFSSLRPPQSFDTLPWRCRPKRRVRAARDWSSLLRLLWSQLRLHLTLSCPSPSK